MADYKDIVKLGVDGYKGNVEKYSVKQSQDTLREALIEANNGSTKLDYRAIRDGKCVGLFAIIEEILKETVMEGIMNTDFFNALVEYRNVGEGDENLFIVEDDTLFVVDDVARGNQGIRRQRIAGQKEIVIPTSVKAVRIYEELSRILAGRVDFNHLINVVGRSFQNKLMDDIYAVWATATADDLGGATYFPTAGTYNEDALLELIAHIEAAAGGKQAVISGTAKALRQLKESIQGDSAKEELHEQGFYGYFFGTPCVKIPQRHKIGTTDFVYPDNVLTIIAGDSKPIKVVREGNPLIIQRDATENMDLTQEYFCAENMGIGFVMNTNTGIGRYETT